MTKNPFSFKGSPQVDERSIDRLLLGQPLGSDAGPAMEAVSELILAARAPASPAEIAGEATVLAAFSELARFTHPFHARRSPMSVLSSRLGSKLSAIAAVGAVSIGMAATAYAGELPAPVQELAHKVIGAPAPHKASSVPPAHKVSGTPSPHAGPSVNTPTGPDATGKSAHGLCTAYRSSKANESTRAASVAFRNLATAAGGADKIATYCATARPPGGAASDHPAGKPSTHPTDEPKTRPSHEPKTHPTPEPKAHPTPERKTHPTDKPKKDPHGQTRPQEETPVSD